MHQRTRVVDEASYKLRDRLYAWEREHIETLTWLEVVMIVQNVLSDYMRSYFRMQLRLERHGTTEKKADEE